MTNDQLPLFPTLEPSPHACARAISAPRADCGVYQHTSLPAGASPRAGDLLSDLSELNERDLAILEIMRGIGCSDGVREELVEKRCKARLDDARKTKEAIARAEADCVTTAAEVVRQARWAEYLAWRDDATSYLYE